MHDLSDEDGTETGETVVVLQGPLAELQRAAGLLNAAGIEAYLGSSEADDCCSTPKLWLEVARADAERAAQLFHQDWCAGLDEEQIAALEAASRIVIDPEARDTTCPACMTTFPTGPVDCPECGLRVG